jgi:hypothetical protein
MANAYTLKNIPEDLLEMARRSARANFRSLQQEILYRVQSSFDAEQAAVAKLHQAWVDEGLQSGPARPLDRARLRGAIARGLRKARK